MMRMQFVPFPLMNPLHPSSVHIFFNPLRIDNLYSSLPALCTWYRILSLSSGETTVLDTAPATPPAINAAVKGEDTCSLIFHINVLAAAVVGAYSMISIYPSSQLIVMCRPRKDPAYRAHWIHSPRHPLPREGSLSRPSSF